MDERTWFTLVNYGKEFDDWLASPVKKNKKPNKRERKKKRKAQKRSRRMNRK